MSLRPWNPTKVCFDVLQSHVSANALNRFFPAGWCTTALCQPVRQYLYMTLSNRWIGRGRPISRRAHSLGLTAFDFILWAYVKTEVIHERPLTIAELKGNITEAISNIDENTPQNIFENIRTRLGIVVQQEGAVSNTCRIDQIISTLFEAILIIENRVLLSEISACHICTLFGHLGLVPLVVTTWMMRLSCPEILIPLSLLLDILLKNIMPGDYQSILANFCGRSSLSDLYLTGASHEHNCSDYCGI